MSGKLTRTLEYMRDNPTKYVGEEPGKSELAQGFVAGMMAAITQVKIQEHVDEFGVPPYWAMGGDSVMLEGTEVGDALYREAVRKSVQRVMHFVSGYDSQPIATTTAERILEFLEERYGYERDQEDMDEIEEGQE